MKNNYNRSSMKNEFKAPQSQLRTSWVQMAFSKPKTGGTLIKRSLSSRSTPIIKSAGRVVSGGSDNTY